MIFRISDNILSPLGETTLENYQAVRAGNTRLCRYDAYPGIPQPFTASLFTEEQNRRMAVAGLTRFESLAYASASRAIRESGIDPGSSRVVFILSTTKGNIELISQSPSEESILYPCTAAQHIAQRLGITTVPITVCNACISGVSAMVLALRLLEAGTYDYAVVCGADTQCQFTISGFQSLKAVSESQCRPFDIERLGMNLGEAAATIVFARQSEGDAWAVQSGAVRNDAFHISSPSMNGEGARLTIDAITGEGDIQKLAFVNAHGTATLFNDQMESIAIERAGLQDVPVNALKGYYGHTLGAAGILETILSMASVDDHCILGTRGFNEIGVSGQIKVSSETIPTSKQSFIKMISGFGGCNAAVLVTKDAEPVYECKPSPRLETKHHVRITPTQVLVDGNEIAFEGEGKSMLTNIYKRRINNYPKFYKMDSLSRLGFVASELLLEAEGRHPDATSSDRAVVLFNHSSSVQADKAFQASIQDPADYFPSPAAFVYTLPNIVAGEISIRNHYQGETSFYVLPAKDERLMELIINATFGDKHTRSVLGGWLDYKDDARFEADLFIVENQTL